METLEQPVAKLAVRYARRARRRQGYAQETVALRAHEGPFRYATGGLPAGPEVDDRPLVVFVNLVAHREHGVRVVTGTATRLRLRDEWDPGRNLSSPCEVSLDLRGYPCRSFGHAYRIRRALFRGLCRTARRSLGRSFYGLDHLTRIQAAGAEHGRQEREQQEGGSPPHLPPASGHARTST